MPKKTAPTIDPRSDEIILAYVGDGSRSARNAPARHLTGNDIARLAYVEALAEVSNDIGRPIDPEDPDGPVYERPDHRVADQARCAEIIAALVESGLFSSDLPEADPEPTPAPAAPAEAPEA